MQAGQVKRLVKKWVYAHHQDYPGLVAAHLVGSITTTADEVPFARHKDVDFVLIFAEGSPPSSDTVPSRTTWNASTTA